LITGASGGLGKAIIPYLSEQGYTLALQADQRAEELIGWLTEHKIKNADVFKARLTDLDSCKSLLNRVEDQLGGVSYLINNAGINRSGSAHKLSASDFDSVLQLNVTVPFYLSSLVAEKMIEQGYGRIVHMSSVVARLPVSGTVAYAASKAALTGMARAQAADWAKFGITVNCIAPGYMDKGMIEEVPEKILGGLLQQIPSRKLGDAAQLGELVVFLFGEGSSYINGQTIGINGGML
jgi:NAD(P)-dependent dehydrogenase (short-subunit alcohol dehydrogenase family)